MDSYHPAAHGHPTPSIPVGKPAISGPSRFLPAVATAFYRCSVRTFFAPDLTSQALGAIMSKLMLYAPIFPQ